MSQLMQSGRKSPTFCNCEVDIARPCVLIRSIYKYSAKGAHHFLSVTKPGVVAIVGTTGNDDCFIILRGGKRGTNYDADSIKEAKEKLRKANTQDKMMVDCSHGR